MRTPARLAHLAFLACLCLALIRPWPASAQDLPLETIQLPPGFSIAVYARVPGARSLALGPAGTVFVGTRDDAVFALTDKDGDRRAETVHTIDDGLRMPNGVALRNGDLYVAEISRVLRYPGIEERLDDPPEPQVVSDAYPKDEWHGWKYIAFGPDGLLYVPVGAPCNVCPVEDPYATITRLDVDSGEYEVFARGIRNTVGFAFHPDTDVLWFTNNGRDWMGDTSPPDSLHQAPEPGLHFGFPYCHAGVPDPAHNQGRDCEEFAPAQIEFKAHVATLGMAFYTGTMFPGEYRGDAFVAQHGSWNRSEKVGYRVVRVQFAGSRAETYEPFAQGWLRDGEAWGRPVDVLQMPDGALLLSDDHSGTVYRITHQ
jgi:glucose/arabinose dehydrogenase